MNMQWLEPHWLLGGAAALLLIYLTGVIVEKRKRLLCARFSSVEIFRYAYPVKGLRLLRWALLSLAVLFVCVSLADPRYGVEISAINHRGRDLIVILDISRSMLATDIAPNRLRRAKLDLLEGLQKTRGHRLGLIAFSGRPKEISPLTYDYVHFAKRLREIEPESIPFGGTNIGDALRMANDSILAGANLGNLKDIILITDGEDLEASFPEDAAKESGKRGVSIYTVGIGQAEATSIRLKDGSFLTHAGNIVKTALNPEPLQLISQYSAGGFYQNLAVTPDWMSRILEHIDNKEQVRNSTLKTEHKIPRYYYFLMTALILWALSFLIPDRIGKESVR
ncbi:MAG: VWA domain-containing protein [Planctomycetes bacterium]|nr:VWA domain-containing protein [Planctomycetota bacterium]